MTHLQQSYQEFMINMLIFGRSYDDSI